MGRSVGIDRTVGGMGPIGRSVGLAGSILRSVHHSASADSFLAIQLNGQWLRRLRASAATRHRIHSSPCLGFISRGLDLRDGIIQGNITQPLLALLRIIALADRELVQKSNGVHNPHLFEKNARSPTADFEYRSCCCIHMSNSITSSVGDTTVVSSPSKLLAFLKNVSSQVQK